MEDLYTLCAKNRYLKEFTASVPLPELQIDAVTSALFHANRWNIRSSNVA
jgi:hypothetical protein